MVETDSQSFQCQNCGHSFLAHPPYNGYDIALPEPCPIEDHDAPQLYECENCSHRNVLYWCHSK